MSTILRSWAIPALLLGTAMSARASHYMGGNITWQCQGGDNYLVTLDLFFDCSAGSVVLDQILHAESACNSFDTTIDPPPLTEVSQVCPAEIQNTTCNGGGLQGVYQASYQTVLHLPPCAGGWRLWWSTCCRGSSLDLVGAAGIYLEGNLRNDLAACDDSPVFSQNSVLYSCVGQPVNYNFGITEDDGDSLVFSLVSARGLGNSNTPNTYVPGYTPSQPIVGTTIDQVTGQLQFTPSLIGNTVFAVDVEEYDAAGSLIGSVMRDITFVALPCAGSGPQPVGDATLNGPGGPGTTPSSGAVANGPNAFMVCNGQPICFSLVFEDPDPGTLLSLQTQVPSLLPGATLNVTGTNPLTVTVCWTGDVNNSPVDVLFQVNDGSCPIQNFTATSVHIVSVSPNTVVDAGTSAVVNVCSAGTAINLFGQLGGTPQSNGTWAAPDGSSHSNQLDPAVDGAGTYTYTVGNACVNASSTVEIAFVPPPDPGTDGLLVTCEDGSPMNLITGLGGTPASGGSWSLQGGAAVAGTYDPQSQDPGVFEYTVAGALGCGTATAKVTVQEIALPDAGINGSGSFCANGSPVDLFTKLGGTPSPGGTWTGPSTVVNGMYDPVTMDPGTYLYTVNGTPPCGDVQATVTVSEISPPNAGTDAAVSVCTNGPGMDLFSLLGGSPATGGTWSGASSIVNGMYDPLTMDPGAYVYTVQGTMPCSSTSATVQVSETGSPDAGTNGALTLCANGVPTDLFPQLGGSPDAGGAWSGPSAITGGYFDPATDQAGTYTYTLNANAPCLGDQADVVVTLTAPPDAGTDGTLAVCDQGAAVGLIAALVNADAGGTWSGPSTVTSNMYDPATMVPGAYVYTVSGATPCASTSATVQVSETGSPDAGTNGALTLCANGVPTDLFPQLGGSPDAGGAWSGPSAITGGFFDPATDQAGTYTYTLGTMGPCPGATSNVQIALEEMPDAGASGVDSVCMGGPPFNLMTVLQGTPDAGGSWTFGGASTTGNFDPASSASGNYVYTVPGTVCAAATATASIFLVPGPDAGLNNAVALCSTGPTVDLLGLLSGTPQTGGGWAGPDGPVPSGTLLPASASSGNYTYTALGDANCPSASSVLAISISDQGNAGSDGALSLCSNQGPAQLTDALGGTPDAGGVWTGPSPVGPTGTLDPATAVPGTYAYSVSSPVPCPVAVSEVLVSITQAPNAGDDAQAEFCSTAPSTPLFSLLAGSPDPNGTWTGPAGTMVEGGFTPGVSMPGMYQYDVPAVANCPQDTALVTISVSTASSAGGDGDTIVCANAAAFPLGPLLQGPYDTGGLWSGPTGALPDNVFDPATDPAGTYRYIVTSPAPCQQDTALVSVQVLMVPTADPVFTMASGCVPVEVTFNSGYNGGGTCHWDLGDGMSSDSCGTVTVTYGTPGTYAVAFSADAAGGCVVQQPVSMNLVVSAPPTAAFGIVGDQIGTNSPVAAFNNESTGANAFEWDFGGLGTSTITSPQFTFPSDEEGRYEVCLTAYATPTCTDTACTALVVPEQAAVFIPNSFSPDGDGRNEVFMPVGNGVGRSDYAFTVLDRWGRVVFRTSDPDSGWNGELPNGAAAPTGVYVWQLSALDAISATGFKRMGHVTLMR